MRIIIGEDTVVSVTKETAVLYESINFNYVHDRMPGISGTVSFGYEGFNIGIQYNNVIADSVAATKNFYFSR